mmetsp:Transcript_2673/g.10392  ORF Transcript_2673/g.10392 Transcript_2673/m.10392 type:complete len:701 (+) Transcript_2673:112-2214(+)
MATPNETIVTLRIVPGQDVSGAAAASDAGIPVMVTVETPAGTARTPSDICCVVDVSGSMSAEAMLKTESGDMSGHGLSVLDIVKHALKTIIRNLNEGDRLAVVSYSNDATKIFDLTSMTDNGRRVTEEKLNELSPSGMTNLWDGLKMGFELLKTGHQPGHLQHIMLFTDGLPNINPPRGILPMLKRLKDKEGGKLPCTVSTFGFGYELDSDLLSQLASDGSGAYNFIPDAGFVGTVFVNALANLLVTIGKDTALTLEPCGGASFVGASPFIGGHHVLKKDATSMTVGLGMLQYGQTKDLVVQLQFPAGATPGTEYLKAKVEFVNPSATTSCVEEAGPVKADEGAMATVEPQRLRLRFADTLRAIMAKTRLSTVDKAQGKAIPLAEALVIAQAFVQEINESPAKGDEYVQGLLEDVTGQVTEALSKDEWYSKWGVHYLPSLMFAHQMQQCNNFKDAGVQNFGGELFEQVRDAADEIFLNLPAPSPSVSAPPPMAARASVSAAAAAAPTPAVRAPQPVVNMAAFHDRYGGCFGGDCLVLLADGTLRKVSAVRKGDRLAAQGGASPSEVLCIARTVVDGGVLPLVELEGGLQITAHHPVLLGGEWRFPIDFAMENETSCEAVYTFLLQEGGSAVVVDGVPCVALGHGLTEGAADHPYLGSWHAVSKDLEMLPGFHSGLVDLSAGTTRRDPATGLVCSLAGDLA